MQLQWLFCATAMLATLVSVPVRGQSTNDASASTSKTDMLWQPCISQLGCNPRIKPSCAMGAIAPGAKPLPKECVGLPENTKPEEWRGKVP